MNSNLLIAASALALAGLSAPAWAQHQHMPGMKMPIPEKPTTEKKSNSEKAHPSPEEPSHEMHVTGALGSYPLQRESSGTAWQPDASSHMGLMAMSGG